jgi:hypothetical protein
MIELRITYDEATGNVNVNGPVNNKGLCYMMLECARDAVKDHIDNVQKISQPILPTNDFPSFIRGRSKRKR